MNHVNTELLENLRAVNITVKKKKKQSHGHTDQDLAEGFVFQIGQVFSQFTGVEVIKQQGHFPLFGHRWDTLGHLPLPFI